MTAALKRRIVCGILVGAFWCLAVSYMPGWVLFAILSATTVVCLLEFFAMMRTRGMVCGTVSGSIAALVWMGYCYAVPPVVAASWSFGSALDTVLPALLGFALMCRLLFDARIARPIDSAAFALLGFFYLPFMLSFFLRLAQWGAAGSCEITRAGVMLAFYLALVVKFSDVGAFAVGTCIGRHKMFPRISPGKSWEGLAGGLAASALMSVLVVRAAQTWTVLPACGPLVRMGMIEAAGVGVALGGIGVVGDLIESMFKRAASVKDSGGIFPGMGGLLDTFDSLVFAPAVFYFYLTWMG